MWRMWKNSHFIQNIPRIPHSSNLFIMNFICYFLLPRFRSAFYHNCLSSSPLPLSLSATLFHSPFSALIVPLNFIVSCWNSQASSKKEKQKQKQKTKKNFIEFAFLYISFKFILIFTHLFFFFPSLVFAAVISSLLLRFACSFCSSFWQSVYMCIQECIIYWLIREYRRI